MTELGIFLVPGAEEPEATVRQALAADEAGLDYVAVQDHPYQRRFLDTWTFLSYVAARTERVRLVTDVINLPLRLPSVLAKSAASLDVLSGGRVELGIGAGSFWEAVEAMGGPRRTPKESVDALEEAIAILRAFWSGERSATVEGEHYRVAGAKPGPPPAHPIGIWVGAYGPRMLRLTGRLGDGWLPSVGDHYVAPEDVPEMQRRVDEGARRAGRDPAVIKRVANLIALDGEPSGWRDQLLRATELGFEALLVGVPSDADPVGFVRRLGEEVAPAVRETLGLMFDQLSDRLQETLSDVRNRGKLSEDDVDKAMREIRLALLEADVNFKVVKQFTTRVKERCLGAGVLDALNPGQQVVKIVGEELGSLMGGASRDLAFASSGTTVVLMAGLQGSGKTTACAKLAKHLGDDGKKVGLAACDTQRPAAVEQLVTMGKRSGATVFEQGTDRDPVEIAEWALGQARSASLDVLIVDTAGRLHIDEQLMDELAAIRKRTKAHDVLLVLDAMTGQDAVNVAESFAERVEFDGVVLTKLDGDARGGAALSVKAVTGKPIMYASTGERVEQLERFHPERMASRILGMGDVMSLIEKAEEVSDADQAAELERKIRKQQFTLEDFLTQMRQVRKMGPLQNVLGMMPGMGKAAKQLRQVDMDDAELDRLEAIILSMTPAERANPAMIDGSRRKRIARGSGTTVQAVNQLVKQFGQMRKMMAQLARGKMPDPQQLMKGMR